MGLHYKTDTQDGYTDSKGTFKYENGENVEFFLGDLSLGEVEAGAMITPYTLAGVEDASDEEKAQSKHATNIALLLQNLDFQRENGNILDLSKFKGHKFTDTINLHKDSDKMHTDITSLMNGEAKDKIADGAEVMTADIVQTHLKTGVKAMEDEHKKHDKLSDLYDNTYHIQNCTNGECKADGDKFSAMNAKSFTLITQNGTSIPINYSAVEGSNSAIKISDDLYTIFSDTSRNVVVSCSGSTLDEAKKCSKKQKLVSASVKKKYTQNKEKHKVIDKLSDMYAKTYEKVECSVFRDCTADGTKISGITNEQFVITKGEDPTTYPYTIIEGTITKITVNGGFYHIGFANTRKKVISTCEGTLLKDAQACSKKSTYVLSSAKDKYMADEDKHNLAKTEVTENGNIENSLYTLIRDADNKISHSLENNTLEGTVHKYDLSGKTIEKENFTNSDVFGNANNLASNLPNSTFIFAQGSSMYCTATECFVDKATINQMLKQANATLVH
jgi:hypothetical protein